MSSARLSLGGITFHYCSGDWLLGQLKRELKTWNHCATRNPLGPGRVAAPEQSSGQELGRQSPSHAPGSLLTQLWGGQGGPASWHAPLTARPGERCGQWGIPSPWQPRVTWDSLACLLHGAQSQQVGTVWDVNKTFSQ